VRRTSTVHAVVAVVAVTLTVCSTVNFSARADASPTRTRREVVVKTFQFRPSTRVVAPGTKVVWRNRDAVEHTVTSKGGSPAPLDGTLPRRGARYAIRLDTPGSYEYFCARHPSMTGRVMVR
jgi:plastocyanin